MERVSFDVTDYDWDTEKSSDVGSVVSGSSRLGSSVSAVKGKRIGLMERLADVSDRLGPLRSVSLENKPARSDQRKSTALKGLRFISKADSVAGWTAVERRFVEITATSGGLLPRSKFGECIGMDSIDFALELFDALARRRFMTEDMIDQDQLRDFWEQISDQSIVSRLQIFIDMLDRDANGRLTEDEVVEIINSSSVTNNLLNIQKKAYEYAATLMEELDPDNIGYIMIEDLMTLLLHAETRRVSRNSEDPKEPSHTPSLKLESTREPQPLKRWYSELRYFASNSWQTVLKRPFRSSTSMAEILKIAIYPGNVLSLHMSRPKNFRYESGQYMLVNCPTISTFQWHPFSITSAPQDDYLSVHIKVVGDWTNALKEIFYEVCKPPPAARDMYRGADNSDFPKIMIDGPHSAPAQDYKKYKVVLLVGLGIGASPMISIVKDIINNTEEHSDQLKQMETRKAYFYWVTKEQGSYEWFRNTMNEVSERDTSRVIDVYNYCTSVYEEGDVRSAFICMLQSLNFSKNGFDIVSETRFMSCFGKPNWKNVYKRIALNHYGSHVGVFYCGELALAEELRHLALEFTDKTSTRFSFHKENFYPQC